jgi:(4S)-4-hydroxy-5-phosphonooxypentane-2,3-dione isomerase
MIVVLVFVHVKKGSEEIFREASIENATKSLTEPGFLRFDIMQQDDDPAKFVFCEIYKDAGVPVRHKESSHYLKWRSIVDGMMEETRYSIKYTNIYPADSELQV